MKLSSICMLRASICFLLASWCHDKARKVRVRDNAHGSMHACVYIHSECLLVSKFEAAQTAGQQRDLAILQLGEHLQTHHVLEI